MADQLLDCKGLNCPMPIIKMSKAIKKMDKGQTLEVLATDPAFEADVYAWAKRLKHDVLVFEEGPPLRVVIAKGR
jgi:tRNA 2-thiouridine synthesizing protein A